MRDGHVGHARAPSRPRASLGKQVQRTIAKPKVGAVPARRDKENACAGNASKALKPAVPTARALGMRPKPPVPRAPLGKPPAKAAAKPGMTKPGAPGPKPAVAAKPGVLAPKPAVAPKPGVVAPKPVVPTAPQGAKRALGRPVAARRRTLAEPGPEGPERPAKAPRQEQAPTFCRADFTPGEVLGNGQFGVVRKCTEKRSGRAVVLKVFDKGAIEAVEFSNQVRRELELQSHLQHPHILRAFCQFEDAAKVHLVLEYAERGSLRNGLCCGDLKVRTYLRQHAARLVRELCLALDFCHQHHVIHRDVKLENLLLTRDWQLKLADFGWAVRTGRDRRTLCGTPEYFAPEIHESYDQGVDVWCTGVVAHELLKRDVPPSPLPPPEDPSWAGVSPAGQQFLRTLLVGAAERPSITGVLQLEWLNSRPSQ